MKKIILLFFLGLMFKSSFLFACSCGWQVQYWTTFCETPHDSPIAKIVITENRIKEDLVNATVLDEISGGFPTDIIIKEQDGGNCNAVINGEYSVGDTLIASLFKYDEDEYKGYYGVFICGYHILKVENDSVVGKIAPNITKMSYEDFKKYPCSQHSYNNCYDEDKSFCQQERKYQYSINELIITSDIKNNQIQAIKVEEDSTTEITIQERNFHTDRDLSYLNKGDTVLSLGLTHWGNDIYSIDKCPKLFKVVNGMIDGHVHSTIRMSYSDFKNTTCSRILSSPEKQFQEVSIFPNSSKNYIEITSIETIVGYQIIDLQGQIVDEKSNQNWQRQVLDIRFFSKGIYFVQLQTLDKMITKRIIKL